MFIDETWVKTNMAPIRGWCQRGKRLIGKVAHGHWRTLTFIAALRHKGKAVNAALVAACARLVFLPPYSPDLNPIEQVFAKLKTALRKAQARTIDAVVQEIACTPSFFSAAECANYFRNVGYASI